MIETAQWITLNTPQAVAERAVEEILRCAGAALEQQEHFKLVLAGGRTPALTYAMLAEKGINFSRWMFFLGDERCLPPEHPDRNSQLVVRHLLKPAQIPLQQFFPIPAELGAETGAQEYEKTIEGCLPFDCVLLGLGEDGHTASLFPGHSQEKTRLVVPVHNAPKAPSERISLTATALNTASTVVFLVAGKDKCSAVQQWRCGDEIPAATVSGAHETLIFVDKAANC